MPPVPLLSGDEVVGAFSSFGWTVARRRGSPIVMTKAEHVATLSIPNRAEVARGTLRSLIRAAGLTPTEFVEALQ
jgi:predicted RNA binding protein YcfA (HicA-like mRNA interferase family)